MVLSFSRSLENIVRMVLAKEETFSDTKHFYIYIIFIMLCIVLYTHHCHIHPEGFDINKQPILKLGDSKFNYSKICNFFFF